MQRIVIDTNVLVSALIQSNFPYKIINELFIEGKISLCISNQVMQEYYDVLYRRKFSQYPEFVSKAKILLADIETKATVFIPKLKIKIIKDIDDNKFLELAATGKANFLITGNSKDFTMSSYKKIKIVSPKEYWEKHHPL